MSAEFMVIRKKISFRKCVMISWFVFTYNTWAQCNDNIKMMRKYESEEKYTVRNLVKNKVIALELAEIYVKERYGHDVSEEEKPYKINELPTSWVVEGTIQSDKIAGGVFIIEIGKSDGRILNFGHSR